MNDEIKEILNYLDMYKNMNEGLLNSKDKKLLLDYITNLQKENEIRQQDINNLTYQLAKEKSRVEKAVELLKNKKEKYKNMTDYHQYYVEGYDKAIELTHSSHSGVMLETIKSATIKNCDDLLNILDGGSDDENDTSYK